MASKCVLKISNLSKIISKRKILDNISLELYEGSIYGFIGNNGAGKTTLMRIITGLARPSSGRIELFGNAAEKEIRKARRRTGALVESPVYYEDMNSRQNLYAQSLCRGKVDKDEIHDLLELVGLSEKTGECRISLRNCSTGMKQRYGLAFAMLGNPELLILDEPINGLDPKGTRDMRNLFNDLNQNQGKTMLISSHILTELYQVATDFIFINHGRIIKQMTHAALESECGGSSNIEQYFFDLVERDES